MCAAGDSSDGSLSQRMLETLLSWMQDHRHPIFIVATASDLSALPPELMRKGRFDDFLFVDLPSEGTQAQVFAYSPRTSQPRSVKVQSACARQ